MNSDYSQPTNQKKQTLNATIDIMKFIMAVLVIGIHAEPFSGNIWLDRAFGMLTRLCVPFFFVSSGYFFIDKNKPIRKTFCRLIGLWFLWTLLYLPYDISFFINHKVNIVQVLSMYFWDWNDNHYLWFIFVDAFSLLLLHYVEKYLNDFALFISAVFFLCVGCVISTWSPLFFGRNLPIDCPVYRNMFFYGFPYVAIGCLFARRKNNEGRINNWLLGFVISMIVQGIEAYLFVVYYKTNTTVLWLSSFFATYYLFGLCIKLDNSKLPSIEKKYALWLRKMSTLLYVTQHYFFLLFANVGHGLKLYLLVLACTISLSLMLILLQKRINMIKYLY